MAYKFKKITAKSPSLMLNQIRDFLVDDCGWTNETPAAVISEDPGNLVTPCFLKSTGEDGTEAIYLNLMSNVGYGTVTTVGKEQCPFTYLAASCSATDTTLSVDNSARFVGGQPFPNGGIVRIGNELIWFAYQATNNLYECKRGYLGTTAASHADGDHVLQEYNSYAPAQSAGPTIESYALRTITAAITAPISAVVIGVASATSAALAGYETNRFAYNCFLRVTSGPSTGLMRRILTYVTATGAFTYEPFHTAPGTQTFDVVSCGFLPTMPRNGTDYINTYLVLPVIRTNYLVATLNKNPQPQACYLYGSKNYLYVVVKTLSEFSVHFFGNVIRHAAKGSALTTADISPGTNVVIAVDDVTPFYVGAKFRILGQSAQDWIDNKARTTFPGSGNPKLYSDEMVTEEITIGAVGASDITVNGATLASYRTGAIIAEDPRPLVTASHMGTGLATLSWMYPCYYPKVFGAYYRQIPAYTLTNYGKLTAGALTPGSGSAESPSWLVERNMTGVIAVTMPNASYHGNNLWEHVKGILPNFWYLVPAGAMFGLSEDTFRARWSGEWRTFRLFPYEGGTSYFSVLGPEIA